jgi:hypothetical protein
MLGHFVRLVRSRKHPEKNLSKMHQLRAFSQACGSLKMPDPGWDSDVESDSDEPECKEDLDQQLGDIVAPRARVTQRPRPEMGVTVPSQTGPRVHLTPVQKQNVEEALGPRYNPQATYTWVNHIWVKGEQRVAICADPSDWGLVVPSKRFTTTAICAVAAANLPFSVRLKLGGRDMIGFLHQFLVVGLPSSGPAVDPTNVLVDVTLTRTNIDDQSAMPILDMADSDDRIRVILHASRLGSVMAIGPQFDWEAGAEVWTVLETGRGCKR